MKRNKIDEQIAKTAMGLIGTVPEVCQRWDKSRKSVMMRIYKEDIYARKIGTSYLVYLPSVTKIWGNPELNREEN